MSLQARDAMQAPHADFELDVRYPALAFLYAVSQPRLVDSDGRDHRLHWKRNSLPVDIAHAGFRIEVRYFGLRVGKAEWLGAPPARLEYRAPWIVLMRGEVAVNARSRGGAVVLALGALIVALPVLAVFVAFRAVDQGASDTDLSDDLSAPREEQSIDAPATSDERRGAVDAAVRGLIEVGTVDPANYAEHVETAAALMTPAFAREYRDLAESAEAGNSKEAESLGAGLIGLDEDRASVLVLLSQTISEADDPQGDVTQSKSAVVASLRMVDGAWLIDSIETGEPQRPAPEADPDRAAALDMATKFAEAFTSIDYRTFDADSDEVLALSTGSFRDSYTQSLDETRSITIAAESVSASEGAAAGLSEFDDDSATVFVSTSGTVSNLATSPGVSRSYLIRLDLERSDVGWLVESMNFI